MRIFVSACLLGFPCRYDGKSVPCKDVIALSEKHTLIPFCPEIYGGLSTPRTPAERVGDRILTKDGKDVTENYLRGAQEALRAFRFFSCDCAILKDRSPSCGCESIYDGTFTGTLTRRHGVTAELFCKSGLWTFGESQVKEVPELHY